MRTDLYEVPRYFSAGDLLQLLTNNEEIFERHHVQFAFLFGSVSAGIANAMSDVDIAV